MGGFSVTAFAQGTDGPADATNDSGVVVEEPEPKNPLTPEGNATLVDDFGGNKQLITVTTKAGNYFYILIDRDDEGKTPSISLNQVDDADLNALLEDGEAKEETPAVCTCTEKCEAGAVNISCPVCATTAAACGRGSRAGNRRKRKARRRKKQAAVTWVCCLSSFCCRTGGAAYYFKVIEAEKGRGKGDG